MQKWILLLTVLSLFASFAVAESPYRLLTEAQEPPHDRVALMLDVQTEGEWRAFVLGGDSVEVDTRTSGYVYGPDGKVGKHRIVLEAVHSGESIVRLTRPDGDDEAIVLYVDVGEDLSIFTRDVTDSGVLRGTVTEVMELSRGVMLETQDNGAILAVFPKEMALPVQDEQAILYTNGTMTLSEPGIVSVIAWEAVPALEQRT